MTAAAPAWLQIETSGASPALLEAVLEAEGAVAVTVSGSGDEMLVETAPGQSPAWNRAAVTGLFPGDRDPAELAAALRDALAPRSVDCRPALIEDRDWVRAWMQDYRPMRFGRRLWVCPHHAEVAADPASPDQAIIRLDPGLAFGTGTHPTTALCLEWLDVHPPVGRRVLDYGCGSGVLALAAASLGAAYVQAVDIDPQSLVATRDNAGANRLEQRVDVGSVEAATPADVVLANILAAPLIDLAPTLASLVHSGGDLCLSGLLAEQADAVQEAYTADFDFVGGAARDGWVRLDAVRH
ncbi:50S ribosomal protein L11 methyltransferase [Spectribacter hydrogenoxidans]|uniref:Ribosomal protein L11 methyltransferase n=1 Tax=Spectribacter hydrogenoxidans TaxID=3075608 RepID=A0ABU3C098_9GAMM|nr:50S ribosomal protein L11 methyltransferase [Salinisphaera sp. W335]MDT0634977.1 50S ribosomal protein L11 methyltransferase [Salinisphaera sp. W335]